MRSCRFSIGELRLQLQWPEKLRVAWDPALNSFFDSDGPARTADISFTVGESRRFDFGGRLELFSTLPTGLWKVWRSPEEGSFAFSLHEVLTDNSPYRVAVADDSIRKIEIFDTGSDAEAISPLEYPLDELIICSHLNINRIGMLLHSALISLGGRGYLFAGPSGSGKSTLSELWSTREGAEVLTDERVIIREREGALWAFGTPWHGTAGIHKNKGNMLGGIFFLKHADRNRIMRLSAIDAANRLMVRCFPTFWNREGMRFVLDFCARIAGEIGCYELGFVPDASAVDFIREWDAKRSK
jgi:hypothetical protein